MNDKIEETFLYYYKDNLGRKIYTPISYIAHKRARIFGSKVYIEKVEK